MIDDLVMKVAAAERVRMADKTGKGSVGSPLIHHSLKTTRWAG
jgi:hypothetical protein